MTARRVAIWTISHDLLQYREMQESFSAAGFTADRCEYRLFDNTHRNIYDPYEVLRLTVKEPLSYLILCHHDVRLDQGQGYDAFMARLAELDSVDPSWAIAGNAGYTADYRMAICITDPRGTFRFGGPFPHRVSSLDENFLVVRPAMGIQPSASLRGFHLYALDYCLNAQMRGRTCYVIDFHLHHLSGGDAFSESYRRVRRELEDHWSQRLPGCVVLTPSGLASFFRWRPAREVIARHAWTRIYLHPRRARYMPTRLSRRRLSRG